MHSKLIQNELINLLHRNITTTHLTSTSRVTARRQTQMLLTVLLQTIVCECSRSGRFGRVDLKTLIPFQVGGFSQSTQFAHTYAAGMADAAVKNALAEQATQSISGRFRQVGFAGLCFCSDKWGILCFSRRFVFPCFLSSEPARLKLGNVSFSDYTYCCSSSFGGGGGGGSGSGSGSGSGGAAAAAAVVVGVVVTPP